MNTSSMKRQEWLEHAIMSLRVHFANVGFPVPANVRVSIGWPKGGRGGKNARIGECWSTANSNDQHSEMFISPGLADSSTIFATIAHELIHATVGLECGHTGAFKACAGMIGLEGKMTATTPGPRMREACALFVSLFGEYPAGALNSANRKKQATRLLKCECSECGYIARVTSKWIDETGAPYCGNPDHGQMRVAN